MIMLSPNDKGVQCRLGLASCVVAVLMALGRLSCLCAQDAPPAPKVAQAPAVAGGVAASQMRAEMAHLKEEGKLTSNREVSAAVRKVIRENSTQHEIPAPLGAKVISVHKHPGDLVRKGDKIVTLFVDGKTVPILAKQDGVMQSINVSKGGVIGNSRPRSAKAGAHDHRAVGFILVTLTPLKA